jgi:hypothetical protein
VSEAMLETLWSEAFKIHMEILGETLDYGTVLDKSVWLFYKFQRWNFCL